MAEQRNVKDLTADADTLALSFEYVSYLDQLYAPVDYETGDDTAAAPPDRRCWIPLSNQDIQEKARAQFDTAFGKRSTTSEFVYMVDQAARAFNPVKDVQPWLLIKTEQGLKALHEDGLLYDPDGSFIPNMLVPVLNEDPDDKAEVLKTIVDWLGGDEEAALSLLHHLATALAPHWSAGKYLLLIGDGRNGKSVLTTMLEKMFGESNCSGVDRQTVAAGDVGMFDLNGKLLNLVYDGSAEFIKDSGREKSLIVGERIKKRKNYRDEQSAVQTSALFIESLNLEPRTSDKSSALQARLVRFRFPNKYVTDDGFFEHMCSERMLGALLALLLDHYVLQSEKSEKLAPTAKSRKLQLEYMVDNSMALQFVVYLEETEPLGAEDELVGMWFDDLVSKFKSWRLNLNDIGVYDRGDMNKLFEPYVETKRSSKRPAPKQAGVSMQRITKLKPDTLELLAFLKEENNAATMVEIGSV